MLDILGPEIEYWKGDKMELQKDFILDNISIEKEDLIELGDWWHDLTWQEIRFAIRETVQNWDDIRADLIDSIEEARDPYSYRGLLISEFVS